ncbi:MAG: DNA polymerase I [Phycisphaerales bacterium]|nr:DNA polymerase I [Phycisphaerales bacterium]
MKTLYLIDGYAQFFRAYHAIRTPMTSPVTGEPTNMTYGFVGMLLKLLKNDGIHLLDDGKADYIAVALDVGGDQGTFRSQLYPEYKANRDAPPEDLFPQVNRAIEMLEAIGVPVIGCEGFEADDVLATIATDFSTKHPDIRVRIISKDKDLKQLLGEGTPPTEMYDVHTDKLITEADLMEDLGIRPDQMIDLLTLMGDTADNIPGVMGIGIKTAAKLLVEFDTLDAIFDAAKEGTIKGKRRENILASIESLPLSKELVTLRHDVPIELDLLKTTVDDLDFDKLIAYCKEFGFNRYQDDIKRLVTGEEPAPKAKPAAKKKPEPADPFSLFNQPNDSSTESTIEVDGDYTIVRTKSELDKLVKQLESASLIAVDTETTHINPMWAELVGISVSTESGKGYYIPTRSPDPTSHLDNEQVIAALKPVLENESIQKVGQNIKYDLLIFQNAGITLRGFVPADQQSQAGDTMIASYVLDSSRSSHSMDNLSLAFLDRTNLSIKDLIGTGKNQKRFDEVALELAGPYAAEDADVTFQLNEKLSPMIHKESSLEKLYREVEMPLVEVLAALEYNGVLVSKDELNNQEVRLQKRIDELISTIDEEAKSTIARTFDLNSPKQLSAALFNKPDDEVEGLGIKPIKKTKTGFSTNAEVLEKLSLDPDVETPIPQLILEYRQLTKLVSTYLKALADDVHPKTKRIHASFHQTVAATGRLSSSDPNLQNIPIRSDIGKEIRKAFIAPPDHQLISADYSQIELRILAHLSDDPALIEAFLAGEDIHQAVAAQINDIPLDQVTKEQRSGAKMVNFGIVYGVTPWGLARRLNVSNSEATEIIDNYKAKFANITSFLEECVVFARSHGYVETMLGRRRPINDIDDRNPQRKALAERMAINSVVQGSAADLIKLAMIDLHQRIKAADSDSPLHNSKMILQIHDELVFETPDANAHSAKALIVERMEAAMDLKVPLTVDAHVSSDWFGGK